MALRFNCKDYNLGIINAQNKDFVQAIVAAPDPPSGGRGATYRQSHFTGRKDIKDCRPSANLP